MKVLVTGSAGHLGEALMRTLAGSGHEPVGFDVKESAFTHHVGSVACRSRLKQALNHVDAVLHAATLHKPHIATHSRHDFVDTNVTGTLNLLEEAVLAGVKAFIFTSTTSVYGHALTPPPDAPAAWITEQTTPIPKNIYGVTKLAAENLCELFQRLYALPCIVLRTSRFFPEADDDAERALVYDDLNLKTNELLYRRADIEDVAAVHLLAMTRAPAIGFGRYIVSATTPFTPDDLGDLRRDAPSVVQRRLPSYEPAYEQREWRMLQSIDRVYVNALARSQLGWQPRYDFRLAIDCLSASAECRSPLALAVGSKGYG